MTMMQTATDRELLGIETSYWEAIKSRNGEDVARMTADDCTIVGASGVRGIDPQSIAAMIEAAPFEVASYAIDPDSVKIVRLDDETVTISYKVHEEVDVDGERVSLEAFDARSGGSRTTPGGASCTRSRSRATGSVATERGRARPSSRRARTSPRACRWRTWRWPAGRRPWSSPRCPPP